MLKHADPRTTEKIERIRSGGGLGFFRRKAGVFDADEVRAAEAIEAGWTWLIEGSGGTGGGRCEM